MPPAHVLPLMSWLSLLVSVLVSGRGSSSVVGHLLSIGSTQLPHSRGAASPVVWLHGYA